MGARLIVNDKPFTIVGVTPPEFFGLETGKNFDVALPACSAALWDERNVSRSVFWLGVMGRLKPGQSVERAAREMETASGAWFDAVMPSGYSSGGIDAWKRFRLTAEANPIGTGSLRRRYESSIVLLLGIAGLVLVSPA